MRLQPEITPGMVLPGRLPSGFVLDDLVIEGWLRDGATAAIYRARRKSDGRTVAVKLQLPTTVRDPILGDRFEREAETLWRLRGTPHVVDLVDVGMLEDGRRYLVLDWMGGGDLDDLLELLGERDQLLPVLRACRIARDVARGVAALHQRGVVHLDLEAPNVMLEPDGHGGDRVALVDFASAADLRELATFEDVIPGDGHEVPSHVSPQRARGGAPSTSCDVFALGVLMFEAISGACAPPEGWPLDTLPRLDTLRHGVPPALADLVQACMSREVGPRPASAKVVAEVLEAVVLALEASEGAGWSGVEDAMRWPAKAANAPAPDDDEPSEGRTGDTLLCIPVRQVMRPEPAVEPRPAPAASPSHYDDPEVAMWARLTAANHAPPPVVAGEPRAGDTEIAMRLPPMPMGASAGDTEVAMRLPAGESAGDTKVAMQLPLAMGDPSLRPDDTWELVPMTRTPAPDPDDTEVAMPLPEERVNPEDTAATLELVRDEGSGGLALLAPGPQDSVDVVLPEAQEDSPPSELEWLAHEQRWWVRWAIAAGVLLVVGGSGAWLVTRDAGGEATAPIPAVTSAVAAEASVAHAAAASERPSASTRNDSWGSTHERERMETQTEPPPAPAVTPVPGAMPIAYDDAGPAEAIAEAMPAAQAEGEPTPKPGAQTSPVDAPACQQTRAQADAGRRERAWEAVLSATRKRRCWSTAELRVERARLRVTAFAELGQLERCIEAGAKIRDQEVADRTVLCRKKLDEQEATAAAAVPIEELPGA